MSLDAGELVTEALGYDDGRRVTVYVPSDEPEAVVYAADGAWHIDDLSGVLEAADDVRPMMIVGVHGLASDEERLTEYVLGFDDERFAAHERFFIDEVPRWIASRFGVALPAERSAVWGASLGAEFALAMGLRHPDRYGAVFATSPGAGFRPPPELRSPLPRVYLVAGSDEPFFLDNARRWAEALGATRGDVVFEERPGGHGDGFWADEFPPMVAWAFGALADG